MQLSESLNCKGLVLNCSGVLSVEKPSETMANSSWCLTRDTLYNLIIFITATFALDLYDTSSTSEFEYTTIRCAEDNCTIICDEEFGCLGATVICPRNHHCDISCLRNQACLWVCKYLKHK